jgi:hypothetical protein
MDWRVFLTTFGILLMAELGDKTQLAVIAMAAQTKKPLGVFFWSGRCPGLGNTPWCGFWACSSPMGPSGCIEKGCSHYLYGLRSADVLWKIVVDVWSICHRDSGPSDGKAGGNHWQAIGCPADGVAVH